MFWYELSTLKWLAKIEGAAEKFKK